MSHNVVYRAYGFTQDDRKEAGRLRSSIICALTPGRNKGDIFHPVQEITEFHGNGTHSPALTVIHHRLYKTSDNRKFAAFYEVTHDPRDTFFQYLSVLLDHRDLDISRTFEKMGLQSSHQTIPVAFPPRKDTGQLVRISLDDFITTPEI